VQAAIRAAMRGRREDFAIKVSVRFADLAAHMSDDQRRAAGVAG